MTEEKEKCKDECDCEDNKDLPTPRFDIVDKMFNEIDILLAENDKEHHLSIFEMEILLLMIRKKVEHLGIMTALSSGQEDHSHGEDNNNSSDMYK
jgi:hypothetical protein